MRIFDTKSRTVQIYLNGAFTDTNDVHDFNRVYYNFKTTENAWTDITFDYTVYEPIYGAEALTPKSITFVMESDGCMETPIYIDEISVFETVSDVVTDGTNTSIVLSYDGMPLKQSESDFPFSIENEFYSTLYDALKNAKSGETIVAHRNYTMKETDNFSEYESLNSVCIDLCGYKLYATDKSGAIINAKASSSSVASSITLKNGSVYLCSAPLIDYKGSTTGGNGKIFNITLENLYVTNVLNSALSNFISSADTTNASEISVNVNLDNCNLKINLKNNSINPITVLNNGEAGVKIAYNIKGSEIELNTLVNVKLWQKKSMVNLYKNEDGKYLILKLPVSAGETGITASREGDIVSFVNRDTSNYIASFETEINPNATKYGIIPDEYLDAELYPFILFDKNENFIGAYKIFMSNDNPNVLDAAKFHLNNGWDGSSYGDDPYEAFILMRRDYVLQSEEKYNNLAQAQGTINIDLGGFALSCGKRTIPMLPGGNKGWNGAREEPIFPSTFIVSNGTVEVNNRGAVTMRSNDNLGGGKIADKTMTFIYNNVTFAFDPSNNVSEDCDLLTYFSEEAEGTFTASPYYTVFNDCVFDLSTTVPSHNVTLFNLNTDGFYIKHSITVNGGKIIASNPARVTVVNEGANNYGSSIFFGVGSDGHYLTYSVPKGADIKDVIFTAENGNMYFEKTDTFNDADVYTLVKSTSGPIQTIYGTIPTAYTSATEYPFVLFCNGSFDNGYTTWVEAITAANSKMNAASKKDVSVVILMRRSYDCSSTDNFANLAQSAGKITIDFGGFTMKAGSKVLFNATAKANDYTTTIEINNGSLLATSNALVYIATGSTAPATKTFDITFNNVIFGFDGTVGSNTAIVRTPTSSSGNYVCNYNVYFNNCIFDFMNYTQNTRITIFNLNNTSATDNEKVNVFINSGSFILPSFEHITISSFSSNDSITFIKEDGNYTSLVLPKGVSAPTDEYVIDKGRAVFVKVRETQSHIIYRLRNSATLDVKYTPKVSITLDNAIILNVYAPVNKNLQTIVFNDKEYAASSLKNLKICEVDGAEYYVFNVILNSTDAAKTFTLQATLLSDTGITSATFSCSVPKYAATVLESDRSSDVEKTLASDVLAYIRAAYLYFNTFNTEEEITRVVALIDSIIGDYEGTPTSTGVTSTDKDELVTHVTLNLDAKPTLRFYVTDISVTFRSGDKVLRAVRSTSGMYIELDVYAYALCETITYGDGGSYHISSFLNGALGTTHEELVKTFIKYTESAAAYRSYALSQNIK
ncbi:MAG: hypothetical protein E7673_03985 [Ruminococcaceae bacterium]|nr:hypothetical protein [Oscillospiraceae bacterium]